MLGLAWVIWGTAYGDTHHKGFSLASASILSKMTLSEPEECHQQGMFSPRSSCAFSIRFPPLQSLEGGETNRGEAQWLYLEGQASLEQGLSSPRTFLHSLAEPMWPYPSSSHKVACPSSLWPSPSACTATSPTPSPQPPPTAGTRDREQANSKPAAGHRRGTFSS